MIDDRKTTVPSGGTDITAEDIPLGVPVLKGPGFFSGLLSGILLTQTDNSSAQGFSAWSIRRQNNTKDRIFLLSYAEVNKYLNETTVLAFPTPYASKNSQDEAVGWWLRSPGYFPEEAAYADGNGDLRKIYVSWTHFVRPALWVVLESGAF